MKSDAATVSREHGTLESPGPVRGPRVRRLGTGLLLGLMLMSTAGIGWWREHRSRRPVEAASEPVLDSVTPAAVGVGARAVQEAPRRPLGQSMVAGPDGMASDRKPWWTALTPSEVAVRREDYEWMHEQPGVYPELGEIVRQLSDAGVPMDLVRLEAREILGALLQRRLYATAAVEAPADTVPEASDAMAEANRELAELLERQAAAAEAEVVARLAAHGIQPGTPGAWRILQLRPTTPLRPLPEKGGGGVVGQGG